MADMANIPDTNFQVKEDGSYGANDITITVTNKANVTKDFIFKADYDADDDKMSAAKTKAREKLMEATKFYHEGPKKTIKTVTELRNENPGITNAELTKLFNNQ